MEKLDKLTYDVLMYTLKKKGNIWDAEDFRKYRKAQGIDGSTVIPAAFCKGMLLWRKVEFSDSDWGKDGKYLEIVRRVMTWAKAGQDVRWVEFRAHKAGQADMTIKDQDIEIKTACGNWLYSRTNTTISSIVEEYSHKQEKVNLLNPDYKLDILCTWSELLDWMSQYKRSKKGPAMGAEYWFRECVQLEDGNNWVVVIQNWKASEKKVAHLQACPYNRMKQAGK